MLDTYHRTITYLRLSVTDRCNFRCCYCMPEKGFAFRSPDSLLSEDEMIEAMETAAELGMTKLRITGGEPLILPNIVDLCHRAAAVKGVQELCLTTNGSLLQQLAIPLKEAGVQRINISLDTLDPKKFRRITRLGQLSDVLSGIEAALTAGFRKVKINAVLIGGFNDDEIPSLCELTRKLGVDVRFIEWMPMFSVPEFGKNASIPADTIIERVPELRPAGTDGVSRNFQLPNAAGRVGIISPISQAFCGECNRIRLTADGMLKPCLHSVQEYPIKGLHGDALKARFIEAIRSKPAQHEKLSPEEVSKAGRKMAEIGG